METQNRVYRREDANIASARGVSTQTFLTTLEVNLLIFLVLVVIFTVLRRTNRRIYSPRTYVGTIEPWRRLKTIDDDGDGYVDEVEDVKGFSGLFGWIVSAWTIKDETVLRTNGLDGYFFLRYLKRAQTVCLVGCCLTFPILFPLNITGGAGQTGLDILSFGNIKPGKSGNNRLYAHVLVGWVFFGFILFTIYRELVYYITLRQAFMLSPQYSSRISARTVLITTIPHKYITETALRRVFDNVKRVWINTDTKELEELVEEREKTAMQLEAAEVKLIKLADAARRKGALGNDPPEEDGEVEGESGSVAARWLDRKNRPTHKLKFLVGEKVDTIDWCRGHLAELNPKIEELQATQKDGGGKKMNSAFIEFTSQSAAQIALQTLAHNRPLHMAPRYIGITPDEVIWSNLRLEWWERLAKGAAVTAAVTALVIFWAIPVGFVGVISNITYLSEKVSFLKWISNLPPQVLGLISGILPVVMLAVLMALLPIILRLCAKIAGEPSVSFVELKVQNMYFAFQVIQVFLVTTMTSAAPSVGAQIWEHPMDAADLLAENLPKASNFYISFMILQGLAISSGALLQIAGLVLYKVLGFFLDSTPRKQWRRWSSLSGLGWGTVFPVYTNICVIAITYSMIAPLVLGFAVVGLGLLHYAYRYNLLFVYNVNIDTKGLVYPRALYQTMTGVYLAQICLIGLFGLRGAAGPLVLQVLFLIFTVLFQLALTAAVGPLLAFLPKNLEREEESLLTIENGDEIGDDNAESESGITPVVTKSSNHPTKVPAPIEGTATNQNPSMFARFLHPELYENYAAMRKIVPQNIPEASYTAEVEKEAYMNPAITVRPTVLWIPKDAGGVSRQEAAHTGSVIGISDEGATITEDGKVLWTEGEMPPGWEQEPIY